VGGPVCWWHSVDGKQDVAVPSGRVSDPSLETRPVRAGRCFLADGFLRRWHYRVMATSGLKAYGSLVAVFFFLSQRLGAHLISCYVTG